MVTKIRENELKMVGKISQINALFNFNFGFITFLITISSIGFFVFMSDEENMLDPSTAYVCLSLFNATRLPFLLIGLSISNFIQVHMDETNSRRFS